MKYTVLIFTCFLLGYSNAQVEFCPPGAEWSYLFSAYRLNKITRSDNSKIEYIRDSIIDGDTCKILRHNRYFYSLNPDTLPKLSAIKQRGDTIFYRNYTTQNTWQILYNFAAVVQDQWTTFYVTPGFIVITVTLTVESIKFVNNMGYGLRQMTLNYRYNSYSPSSKLTVTERYGADFLFYHGLTGSQMYADYFARFLCYKDNINGIKQFTAFPCDYSDPVALNETSGEYKLLDIYPNPAGTKLRVQSNLTRDGTVSISNIHGNVLLLHKTAADAGEELLDISALPSGMYLVHLKVDQNIVAVRKLIRE